MADPRFPARPNHPDFGVLSRIVIAQDERAESQAASFEEMIAQVVDVRSVMYMASQRALRARQLLTSGPIQTRLEAFWLDAFMAGAAFGREKKK